MCWCSFYGAEWGVLYSLVGCNVEATCLWLDPSTVHNGGMYRLNMHGYPNCSTCVRACVLPS